MTKYTYRCRAKLHLRDDTKQLHIINRSHNHPVIRGRRKKYNVKKKADNPIITLS